MESVVKHHTLPAQLHKADDTALPVLCALWQLLQPDKVRLP